MACQDSTSLTTKLWTEQATASRGDIKISAPLKFAASPVRIESDAGIVIDPAFTTAIQYDGKNATGSIGEVASRSLSASASGHDTCGPCVTFRHPPQLARAAASLTHRVHRPMWMRSDRIRHGGSLRKRSCSCRAHLYTQPLADPTPLETSTDIPPKVEIVATAPQGRVEIQTQGWLSSLGLGDLPKFD